MSKSSSTRNKIGKKIDHAQKQKNISRPQNVVLSSFHDNNMTKRSPLYYTSPFTPPRSTLTGITDKIDTSLLSGATSITCNHLNKAYRNPFNVAMISCACASMVVREKERKSQKQICWRFRQPTIVKGVPRVTEVMFVSKSSSTAKKQNQLTTPN